MASVGNTMLRNRRIEGNAQKSSSFDKLDRENVRKAEKLPGLGVFLMAAAFYMSIWLLVYCRRRTFPEPLDEFHAKSTDFMEVRARAHLEKLADLGPKVAGSASNFAAENYILNEVKKIRSAAHHAHEVDIDVQTVSGSFVLDFDSIGLGHYTSVYENQHNIVVRLRPRISSNHSLLVNCHYDTVIDSPGASDDAVSCCLMLETLQVLSREEKPLEHNIIFLFNSAEENILQTSHGFITQHKWASSVRAFVNLDSAGAGGWELLFQTGPENPWLIETYILSVPRPCASVFGQEIFQFGLVPSDTDFRIFRDFGHIPGLDIANIRNGYVYHTRNDLPHNVEQGSMQRGGENLLALLKALVSSPNFVDPGEFRHGSLVFFDFLGLFMIAYPAELATILNCIIIVLVVITSYWSCKEHGESVRWPVHLLGAVLLILLTWTVIVVVAVMMGLLLTWLGKDMSYFNYQFNIIWIFIFPALSAGLTLHIMLKESLYRQWDGWQAASLYQQANLCVWAVILAILTYQKIMSAYLPCLLMTGPLHSWILSRCLGKDFKEPINVVCTVLGGSGLAVTYFLYIHQELMSFFIPITGRQGSTGKPDIPIAVMATLPVTLLLPFQVGIIYVSEGMWRVVRGLLLLTAVGLLTVIFTPLGFPYSSSGTALQRLFLVHSDRQFHSKSGEVISHDAQLWLVPLDHQGLTPLLKEKPHLFKNSSRTECTGTYCGRPFLYPMLSRMDLSKSVDLPAPYLNIPRVAVSLINTTHPAPLTHRMTFEMRGPDHVTIFFTPHPGVHVLEWSFGHGAPVTINTLPDMEGDTHFIYYSYGEPPSIPWNFTIDFHVSPGAGQDFIVDMAFAGHYLHEPNQWTDTMTRCAQELPHWIVPVGWTATFDSFQF
ncbi:endoplasmic reticulum metallopeptidase 1-like [Pomacea canaliculata]|uniref:endoplasmic reticulum metallopeptidase 1-like n=1 Tax=Pomacea canaliculata TaxID=400727 RepID=UPI000D7347E9|nr:endoplasmic reticulum metallopeptidase 1-like [Pomacea canaliculata]